MLRRLIVGSGEYRPLDGTGGFLVTTSRKIGQVFAPMPEMEEGHGGTTLSYRRYDYVLSYLQRSDEWYWVPEPSALELRIGTAGEVVITQSGPRVFRRGHRDSLDMEYVMIWDALAAEHLYLLERTFQSHTPVVLSPDPFGLILKASPLDLDIEPIRGTLDRNRVTFKLAVLHVKAPGILPVPPAGSDPRYDWRGNEFIGVESFSTASNGVWLRKPKNSGEELIRGQLTYPGMGVVALAFLDGQPTVNLGAGGSAYLTWSPLGDGSILVLENKNLVVHPKLKKGSIGVLVWGFDLLKGVQWASVAALGLDQSPVLATLEAPLRTGFRVPDTLRFAANDDLLWRPIAGRVGWPYEMSQGLAAHLLSLCLDETGSWRVADA